MDEVPEDDLDEGMYVVDKIISHMTYREACKKFVYGQDGFLCGSYEDFRHSKYVYLIKWLHWQPEHNTWEEEENAKDCEELKKYKQDHGLPDDLEYDDFYVSSYLLKAVKEGQNDVSDDVAAEVRRKQKKSKNKPKASSLSGYNKTWKEVANYKKHKRSSADSDDSFSKKHLADDAAKFTNATDLYISREEQKRKEVQKRKKVAELEKERLDGLDQLEEMESQIKRNKTKSKDSSEVLHKKRKPVEVEKGKSRPERKTTVPAPTFYDADIYDTGSTSDVNRIPVESDVQKVPKLALKVPHERKNPSSSFDLFDPRRRPLSSAEQNRLHPDAFKKLSYTIPKKSASSSVKDSQEPIRHPDALPVMRKKVTITAPKIIANDNDKVKNRSIQHQDGRWKITAVRPRENRQNLSTQPGPSIRKQVPSCPKDRIKVFYNLALNNHFISKNCLNREIPVLRRCQSAEQLNKRWTKPEDNYEKLQNWLASTERCRPKTNSENNVIKSIHLDIRWNTDEYKWNLVQNNKRIAAARNVLPAVGNLPPPTTSIAKELPPSTDQPKKEPVVITLDGADEDPDWARVCASGIVDLKRNITQSYPNFNWQAHGDILIEGVKSYSMLNPDCFHKIIEKLNGPARVSIVKELMRHSQIEGCKPVGLSHRMGQLFEADGTKDWLSTKHLCSYYHRKCRMIDEIFLLLGDGRYHPASPFTKEVLYYCFLYGAHCQKKKFLEWGYPLFDGLIHYPGKPEYLIDHSAIIIRQFNPQQLMMMVELGMDINQRVWKITNDSEKRHISTASWTSVSLLDLFKHLQVEKVDSVSEEMCKILNSILGRMSAQMSMYVQKRIAAIIANHFSGFSYEGFITPAHVMRSVWPKDSAHLIIYVDWEKEWSNYELEKTKCLPLTDAMAEKLNNIDAKLIITVFRVQFETQLPADRQRKVTHNLKLGPIRKGQCVPLSLTIRPTDIKCRPSEVHPMSGSFNPGEWVFEINGPSLNPFLRERRLKISMKTSSNEVGTLFLIRAHVLVKS